MKIIELILDEDLEMTGVESVSLVSNPAIEESWIALKEIDVKFEAADKEKRLITGAALVPNRPIFRKKDKEEFYVYFSKNTVRQASEMFFKNGNQLNATLEHEKNLKGMTVVESWIVDDKLNDKSNVYNLNVPEGTWMISMKVDSDSVWKDYIQSKATLGFSIEGYFSSKFEASKIKEVNSKEALAVEKIEEIKSFLKIIK